jgi:hypothetical protein
MRVIALCRFNALMVNIARYNRQCDFPTFIHVMGHAKAKKPHPGKGAAFRVYQSSGHQNGLKTGRNDTSRVKKGQIKPYRPRAG